MKYQVQYLDAERNWRPDGTPGAMEVAEMQYSARLMWLHKLRWAYALRLVAHDGTVIRQELCASSKDDLPAPAPDR